MKKIDGIDFFLVYEIPLDKICIDTCEGSVELTREDVKQMLGYLTYWSENRLSEMPKVKIAKYE